jgi:transposase-like protein
MGRRGYPPEFRQRVLDLVAAGRGVEDVARDLGISDPNVPTNSVSSRTPSVISSNEKEERWVAR